MIGKRGIGLLPLMRARVFASQGNVRTPTFGNHLKVHDEKTYQKMLEKIEKALAKSDVYSIYDAVELVLGRHGALELGRLRKIVPRHLPRLPINDRSVTTGKRLKKSETESDSSMNQDERQNDGMRGKAGAKRMKHARR
jgi:hypothetical protein